MLPQIMFSILNFAASKGLAGASTDSSAKQLARDFTMPEIKAELDVVA
jgi:hypothetical protein